MQKYKQNTSVENRAERRGAKGVHGQGKATTPRHVSWKYESFLAQEIARLEARVNEEENAQQQRLLTERLDRGKRQKMSLEKPKNQAMDPCRLEAQWNACDEASAGWITEVPR